MQNSLFETRTQAEIEQERAEMLDQAILNALCGRTPFQITDQQREILEILRYRRGISKAINLGEICDRLKLQPRTIKDLVRSLVVDFRLPIGASRNGSEGGYYLVMNAAEALDTALPYIHEALKLFARARVFLSRDTMLKLLGQLELEVKEERRQQ